MQAILTLIHISAVYMGVYRKLVLSLLYCTVMLAANRLAAYVIYALFLLFRCVNVKTARGISSEVCVLRAREGVSDEQPVNINSGTGNYIINIDLYNEALRDFQDEHNKVTQCTQCYVTTRVTKKVGLSCKCALKCQARGCNYERVYPLYMATDERRRGPKRAAVNQQFAHAVQDSGLGMHGASQFIASLDIAPVAPSHCQKLAKLADTEMSAVNQKDMDRIRTQTTLHNALLGLSGGREGEVAISVDTRYNSVRYGDGKKMGLSATQAVTTAIDSCSGKILDFVIENKVCSKGSRLRQHDNTTVCSHESTAHDCSATLPYSDNIQEGRMNTALGNKLLDRGLKPVTVTSDNDGQGAKPYAALLESKPQRWSVVAQSDPSHLGNSQVKAVERINFRKETFSCSRVKTVSSLKKLLGKDVKYRSSMIVKRSSELGLSHAQVNELMMAAVECFCGEHDACRRLAGSDCSGLPGKNWMAASSLKRAAGLHNINCNEEEKRKLTDVFKIRLHPVALQATALGFDTQKNEAFNRALSKNMPKNNLFCKNYHGRVASAVFRYNNGHSSAAKKFSNIGCPLSKGAVRSLQMQGKSIARAKAYQITERYKKRRALVRMRAATEWYKRKANERCDHDYCATDKDMHTGGPQHDYCKGQNDPFRPPP